MNDIKPMLNILMAVEFGAMAVALFVVVDVMRLIIVGQLSLSLVPVLALMVFSYVVVVCAFMGTEKQLRREKRKSGGDE